jgi:ribosomal protein RSM22 (predicted rRNA methylase)
LLAAIDAVASERFGRGDLHGATLARAVQAVSAAYTRERAALRSLDGDDSALCARLRFFLPRDAPKIVAPLAELAAVGALPHGPELRVLDLGAGLGTTSLGAADFLLAQPGIERLQIDAVDQDAGALDLAQALCTRYARDAGLALEMKVQRAALVPQLLGRLAPRYQLILLGFVLNELALQSSEPAAQHARWLTQLGSLLSDDGAIVVLEPALRPQSRALQLARTKLIAQGGPPYLFAPCLHSGTCPLLDRERDWCHERLPLALPATIAAIARDAGLREAELSYSYLTLCRQPRSLAELAHGAPERLYRIVSAPLASKGKLELGLCGPGGATRARRLDRHAGSVNEALEHGGRGQLLRFTDAETIAQDGTLKIGDGQHVERVGRLAPADRAVPVGAQLKR